MCGDVINGAANEEGPTTEDGPAAVEGPAAMEEPTTMEGPAIVDGPMPSAPVKTMKPGGEEGGVDGSAVRSANCPVGLPRPPTLMRVPRRGG